MKKMKEWICVAAGAVGAAIAAAFGGWSAGMTTLCLFMLIDYITGIVVAGIFHASPKSENGSLESRAGWKGLFRKGMTLLIVLIGCRLDMLIGTNYIRDAMVVAFILNELISITENAGLMGIPVPKVLKNAIDILKDKADEGEPEEEIKEPNEAAGEEPEHKEE